MKTVGKFHKIRRNGLQSNDIKTQRKVTLFLHSHLPSGLFHRLEWFLGVSLASRKERESGPNSDIVLNFYIVDFSLAREKRSRQGEIFINTVIGS